MYPPRLLLTSRIRSLQSDRLRGWCDFQPRGPNKRGQFRGHRLTPEGKINGIIITGNNKITFNRPTFERRWKCPMKSRPFFSVTSPADTQTIKFPDVNREVHDAYWTWVPCGNEAWGKVKMDWKGKRGDCSTAKPILSKPVGIILSLPGSSLYFSTFPP